MNSSDYSLFWSVLVPAAIILISFAVTFWLYRYFSSPKDTSNTKRHPGA